MGQNGTLVWPYIKGPAFFQSDLALFKDFRITERQRVEFRASAFNFLNHPHPAFNVNGNSDLSLSFSDPVTHLLTTTNQNQLTTGRPGYTVGNRVLQFAIKYYF